MIAVAVAVLVTVPVVLNVVSEGWTNWIVLCTVPVVLAFVWIRVTVDQHGLTICYGPFPWPRTHIEINRIQEARVEDINPAQWGVWGYRGLLRRPFKIT